MINILICDDEKSFVDLIENKIKKIIINGKFCDFQYDFILKNDSTKAIDFCINNEVDIAFLDIDMPGINGFDVASILNEKQKNTKLIFVSNFDHFVYTSLKFRPFRFIRKSVIDGELKEAFNSAMNDILTRDGFLILGSKYFNEKLFFSDILFIESKGNYVEISATTGEKFLHRTTLGTLVDSLVDYDFVRIHSGFVVSMSKIKFIKSDIVELQNGTTLKISRKYITDVKEKFYDYLRK